MELAFLRFQMQACTGKSFKDLSNMLFVFLQGCAIDQDIIQIRCAKGIQEGAEGIIDAMLEASRGIRESEWHYQSLEKSPTCSESSFPNILICDSDQVVSVTNI